jgi:excisionase family DNA binding protein
MHDELLTFEEACELLKVSDKLLLRLLAEEAVPARKIGNKWRFSKSALIDWIGKGNSLDYVKRTSEEE